MKPANKTADLLPKSLWCAGNNQHRIVFHIENKKVFYGSRGGNIMNKFTQGEECKIERFLNDSSFIRHVTEQEWEAAQQDLASWIKSRAWSPK